MATFDTVEIQTLPVRDNLFMLVGAGGNITVQTGEDGVLIVDTQYAPLSDESFTCRRPIPTATASSSFEEATAPIDLTGQWVSIVTEDWRFRRQTDRSGWNPRPCTVE